MAVYSPDEGKLPSRERPWATPRWQEDVVRAIALCPNEGPLIFTSDAGKWPVRKRARKEEGRERKKEKGRGRGRGRGPPSNRPAGRGNDSLLSILDLSHFYSHPHEPRDYAFSFQFTRVFSSIVSRSSYHLQLRGKTFRRNGNEYQPDTMPNMQTTFRSTLANCLQLFRQISRKRYFTLSLDFSFISRVPYSRTNNISVISDKQFLLSLSSRNNNSVDIRLKRIFPNIPASITN